MLDVSRALRERNTLALSYAVTEMKPARLAGVSGIGTIQVVRTLDGGILELIGTWRLVNDEDGAVEHLKHAFEQQQEVGYEGYFSDPLYPDDAPVNIEVQILSMRPYLHHLQKDAAVEASIKTYYRLKPVGSLPQQYTQSGSTPSQIVSE